jgi:hypothetical protein
MEFALENGVCFQPYAAPTGRIFGNVPLPPDFAALSVHRKTRVQPSDDRRAHHAFGMKLITTRNGSRDERLLSSDDEWQEMLRDHFGLQVPYLDAIAPQEQVPGSGKK